MKMTPSDTLKAIAVFVIGGAIISILGLYLTANIDISENRRLDRVAKLSGWLSECDARVIVRSVHLDEALYVVVELPSSGSRRLVAVDSENIPAADEIWVVEPDHSGKAIKFLKRLR